MKKLNSRETLILAGTLGLVLFFVVFQLILKPVHEGAVDINDKLRTEKDQYLKASQMVSQKSAVEARYRRLVDLIGVVDSEESQMPTIVSKIETAAREDNVHIGNIQPQKSSTQKGAIFLSVELEVDGQWLDIVHFLYTLQQRPNYYFIGELNLEKYSDSTNSLRGRIVISRMCLVNP